MVFDLYHLYRSTDRSTDSSSVVDLLPSTATAPTGDRADGTDYHDAIFLTSLWSGDHVHVSPPLPPAIVGEINKLNKTCILQSHMSVMIRYWKELLPLRRCSFPFVGAA